MESIFNEDGKHTACHGSKCWERVQYKGTTSDICGRFFEELNGEVVNQREYFLSEESLYYLEGTQHYRLELIFTVVEEKLYLRNHKKIFAIRLTQNGSTTVLHTSD